MEAEKITETEKDYKEFTDLSETTNATKREAEGLMEKLERFQAVVSIYGNVEVVKWEDCKALLEDLHAVLERCNEDEAYCMVEEVLGIEEE